jgi:translation initiation factor 2D
VKIRQGRKASTLITNFEPYLLNADFLAEELRRICASATSGKPLHLSLRNTKMKMLSWSVGHQVSPVQGKPSGMEVLVQGKQIGAVTELLMSKGVPKKRIESSDLSGNKK